MTMTINELRSEFERATLEEMRFLVAIDWAFEEHDEKLTLMWERISRLAKMIKALEPTSIEAIAAKASSALYISRNANTSVDGIEYDIAHATDFHSSCNLDLALSAATLFCPDYCEALRILVPGTIDDKEARARIAKSLQPSATIGGLHQ